jgi:hypothetical protein
MSDATSSFKGLLLNPSLDEANTQPSNPSPSSGSSTQRTVLLQIHPSIKASVTEAIGLASQGKVLVEELVELGCLELGGPRCLEMMGRVLTGIQEPEKREVSRHFSLE